MIPGLTSIAPIAGSPGTNVTLYGKNFTKQSRVIFNNVDVPVIFRNSTMLEVKLFESGFLIVINPAPGGTSAALAFKSQSAPQLNNQLIIQQDCQLNTNLNITIANNLAVGHGCSLSRNLNLSHTLTLAQDVEVQSSNIDDSSLAGADVAALCALPTPHTIFNVFDYGAKGDGVIDDTLAIRAAITAAKANTGWSIIYFPSGKYAVCNQATDPKDGGIFDLSPGKVPTTNLIFLGDWTGHSQLLGFMPGLQDPVTHWDVTGDSYAKIGRFAMFKLFSTSNTITNIQFRSLDISGQAPATGNALVGGDPATGDGWDLSHKCIQLNGGILIDNILIFNCNLHDWRGEIVYAGGSGTNHLGVINTTITSSNASAISCSANLLVNNCVVDGTYNGMENFCLGAPQQLVVQKTSINKTGNAIVYIGEATSSCVIEDSQLTNNYSAILLSEMGTDITISRNNFSGNQRILITSILGLYPNNGPTGMFDVTIQDNICNGRALILQNFVTRLKVLRNTSSNGVLAADCYIDVDNIFDSNIIHSADVGTNMPGKIGLWTNNVHVFDRTIDSHFYSIGYRVEDYSNAISSTIRPQTDYTALVANTAPSTYTMVIDPTDYPIGFATTFKIVDKGNWVLHADATWNTFPSDVPVVDGLKIQLNSQRLFELVANS